MERLNECECGEPLEDCVEAWGECLALEFADVRYWAVHHLTVSAFMLQHPRRLSSRGWREERQMLREFAAGVSEPTTVRRSDRRAGPSLVRGEPQDLGDLVWTRTIVGVRRADPATYRADVRAWAAAVLTDVESVEIHGES